jgi:hypothetical protein
MLGNNGHGIYLDGMFGWMEADGITYEAKQVHWVYPSWRQVAKDPEVIAPLEMRIVHQALGAKDYNGLAVIVIPLKLPAEQDSYAERSEKLFVQMGMTDLPHVGAPRQLTVPFNLTYFNEQINKGVKQLHCAHEGSTQKWYLAEAALVTGAVVNAFKARFPIPPPNSTDAPTAAPVDPGLLARLGYNMLGDQIYHNPTLVNDAPDVIVIEDNITHGNRTPKDARWLANPFYTPGCGDFMAAGEWGIPPVDAPVVQRYPPPLTAADTGVAST